MADFFGGSGGASTRAQTDFRCATATSTAPDTDRALRECLDSLAWGATRPDWILAYYTEAHRPDRVAPLLVGRTGVKAVHGGSSCQAVMNSAGLCGGGPALGIFAIHDPEGAYGVGFAALADTPRAAAAKALEQALAESGRPEETPALIWINAAPGSEEELLKGLADVVGEEVPVAGGSTGDDGVEGRWSQIAGDRPLTDGVVVSVLFPSVEISFAFHSGYDPTPHRGVVTAAEGRRILTIDGEPAARVYNRWSGGRVEAQLDGGGNVLAATTLAPLGRVVAEVDGVGSFNLSHPVTVEPDGSMTVFAELPTGTEVLLMEGSVTNLVRRAGRVAAAARDAHPDPEVGVLGALVVYCAGCMLAVGERMPRAVEEVQAALEGAPFFGLFTFGEQGCHRSHRNAHGNLMISVVLFRDEGLQWGVKG